MISRLNFTSRRRIPRRLVAISVADGVPPRFDAALDLDGAGFPPEAAIVVEATRAGAAMVQRFEFGTIAEPRPPADRTLDEIAGAHIRFAVKVIDRREEVDRVGDARRRGGRLLGLAEGIRPARASEGAGGRRPILPVKPEALGQRLWRLAFDENDVYLEVNRDVPQVKDLVQADHRFTSLVYPEIVRQVLERVVVFEGHGEVSGDDEDWRDLWLRFGIGWHPESSPPPSFEQVDCVSRAELDEWLDEIVDGFCSAHEMRDRFEELLE